MCHRDQLYARLSTHNLNRAEVRATVDAADRLWPLPISPTLPATVDRPRICNVCTASLAGLCALFYCLTSKPVVARPGTKYMVSGITVALCCWCSVRVDSALGAWIYVFALPANFDPPLSLGLPVTRFGAKLFRSFWPGGSLLTTGQAFRYNRCCHINHPHWLMWKPSDGVLSTLRRAHL